MQPKKYLPLLRDRITCSKTKKMNEKQENVKEREKLKKKVEKSHKNEKQKITCKS